MNAYELAEELENYVWMNPNNNRDYCKEVRNMLRQQADRIAELEKQVATWEKATMDARIANSLYKADVKRLHDELAKYGKSGQSIPCQYTEGM